MSTPTEAQYQLAHVIRQSSTQERAAQLIADSEARAVAETQAKVRHIISIDGAQFGEDLIGYLQRRKAERDQLRADLKASREARDAEQIVLAGARAENCELRSEVAKLTEREKHCATMDQAQKLALIRALQEIRDALGAQGGDELSPRQIVEAVREQSAEVARLRADDHTETERAEFLWKARAEKAESELTARHADLVMLTKCHDDNCKSVVQLSAELATERARLNFLEHSGWHVQDEDDDHVSNLQVTICQKIGVAESPRSVRAAIDAAMKEGADNLVPPADLADMREAGVLAPRKEGA